jgi:hypothetical protein
MQKKAFTGNTPCIFLSEKQLKRAREEKSIVPGGKQAVHKACLTGWSS